MELVRRAYELSLLGDLDALMGDFWPQIERRAMPVAPAPDPFAGGASELLNELRRAAGARTGVVLLVRLRSSALRAIAEATADVF